MDTLEISMIEKIYSYLRRRVRGGLRQVGSGLRGKCLCGKKVMIKHRRYVRSEGNISFGDYVEIDGFSKSGVSFGRNCTIGKYSIIRGSSSYENPGEGISIGNYFCCGDFSFFDAAGGIQIGDDVQMGQAIRFHAQNHKYSGTELIRLQGVENKSIVIGNNCWVGSGTVFLAGVTIGDGCVIGANSVITKSFPNDCVIAGNPAKIIKMRRSLGVTDECQEKSDF